MFWSHCGLENTHILGPAFLITEVKSDQPYVFSSTSEFHQPEIGAESVNWTTDVGKWRTKEKGKKTEEDFVPGFQGRTGDVKNNGNRES